MLGTALNRRTVDTTDRIVAAVADKEGVDPVDLNPPLGTVVDLDAVERLFARSTAAADLELRFQYRGHDVLVREDGAVTVE
ncbi:HalOD1 output domain-containing protein [Halobacterium wangiae]|uniref:HalOD1 output domain-containing protein n=1 Tax=Halobacterium wangiae TaxID=2902623 RepID=UPI001E6317A2|nr:HalOD1 output domain-containing protein [Halobacterium wangiae]